jgi:hypothetical protein
MKALTFKLDYKVSEVNKYFFEIGEPSNILMA